MATQIPTQSPTQSPTVTTFVTDSEIVTSVAIYIPFAAAILLLYGFFRFHLARICTPRSLSRPSVSNTFSSLAVFLKAYCSWPFELYAMNREAYIEAVGVDIYVGLRLIRMCGHISAWMALYGMVVLVPIYKTMDKRSEDCLSWCNNNSAPEPDDPRGCICDDFSTFSIGNLDVNSGGLWAAVVGAYVLAFITFWHLTSEYVHFASTRRLYWRSRPAEAYTVLVDRVPPRLMESSSALRVFMDRLFTGEVYALQPVTSIEALEAAGDKRERALRLYEHALVEAKRLREAGRGETPRHWVADPGVTHWRRVDSVPFYERELAEANAELAAMQTEALKDSRNLDAARGETAAVAPSLPAPVDKERDKMEGSESESEALLPLDIERLPECDDAEGLGRDKKWMNQIDYAGVIEAQRELHHGAVFVTFRSLSVATVARQTQLSLQPYTMTTLPAPEPRDIRWNAVGRAYKDRLWRNCLAWVVTGGMFVSWGALVTLLAGATNVERLKADNEDLRIYLNAHKVVEQVMKQISPLIIAGLMALVWPILNALANNQRTVARSEVDRIVFRRYFTFIVLQVFLLYTIAGTMFKSLHAMLNDAALFAELLRVTIPANAAFFVKYIITGTFTTTATSLFRITFFLYHALRRMCYEGGASVTPREKTQDCCGCTVITYPSGTSASFRNASVLLILFITLCYALIQPLILLAAVVYFAVMWLATAHLVVHAAEVEYDSGGLVFFTAYWMIVSGLVTSQLLIGVYLIVGAGAFGLYTIPIWLLLIATLAVSVLIDRQYSHITRTIPLAVARQIDEEDDSKDDETAIKAGLGGARALRPRVIPAKIYRYDYLSTQPGDDDAASMSQGQGVRSIYAFRNPVLGEVHCAEPGMDLNSGSPAFGTPDVFGLGQNVGEPTQPVGKRTSVPIHDDANALRYSISDV